MQSPFHFPHPLPLCPPSRLGLFEVRVAGPCAFIQW